jgi:hypothetical protein
MICERTRRCTIFDFGPGVILPDDFDPDSQVDPSEFQATASLPGSYEKIEVMRCRLEQGLPLWHENDTLDLAGVGLQRSLAQTLRVESHRKK